jgi:hypothetical protein
MVAGVTAAVLGLLLGGKSAEIRTTTGLVSVLRFASLRLIISGVQLHGNPTYLGPCRHLRAGRLQPSRRLGRDDRPIEPVWPAISTASPSSRQVQDLCRARSSVRDGACAIRRTRAQPSSSPVSCRCVTAVS